MQFPYIKVYRRPDDGTYLQQKHIAANKLIILGFVCDCFGTYTSDVICFYSPTDKHLIQII
jgi:hypothetical protein